MERERQSQTKQRRNPAFGCGRGRTGYVPSSSRAGGRGLRRGWRIGWVAFRPQVNAGLLIRDLLEIELHARQQQGDLPAIEDYAKRFPENEALIAAVFAKHVRRRLGDYEILREIGRGGMGVVYQAQHRLLNQIVALKVLSGASLGDRQAVRRFQREMLSVGSLNHQNIIRALNAGEERDVHYLVMEYVDGWDFRELVAQQGRLAPKRRLRIDLASRRRPAVHPRAGHGASRYQAGELDVQHAMARSRFWTSVGMFGRPATGRGN